MKYNPYRPDKIITPAMFSGRLKELLLLESCLNQTKNGNANHFAIIGERGIGKSSLCFYLKFVASGEIEGLAPAKHSFVVVSISLDNDLSQSDILCSLGNQLEKGLKEAFPAKDFLSTSWEFIKRWEVLGVAYHCGEKVEAKPFEILEELTATIANASKRLTEAGKDGILFLIDEADKPKPEAHLGRSLKLLSEGLSKRNCNNVLFGLSGLPELFEVLRLSHESAPRVFNPIELLPFADPDQLSAITKGISEANQKNSDKTAIVPEAATAIANHAEGYPHFLQQFAYSAFEANTDETICLVDVEKGATAKGGAIDALGLRYFRDAFWSNIGSDDYRAVLRAMARDGKKWVTRKAIKERTGLPEGTLSNAINSLKERRAILPKPGKAGSYRLPTEAFGKWILREKTE